MKELYDIQQRISFLEDEINLAERRLGISILNIMTIEVLKARLQELRWLTES